MQLAPGCHMALGFYLLLMKCVSIVVGMVDLAHFHMAYLSLAPVPHLYFVSCKDCVGTVYGCADARVSSVLHCGKQRVTYL